MHASHRSLQRIQSAIQWVIASTWLVMMLSLVLV